MALNFKKLFIDKLMIIEPQVFYDSRGFFMETFKQSDFFSIGIFDIFVQDNHSKSFKNTLRGLHFQKEPFSQGKLVRVTNGRIWDVAVDIRKGSSTYGKWQGIELSSKNHLMFWIPVGFAHGFVALEDDSELQYKCTAEYDANCECGIRWNDPDIGIEWPIEDVIISEKDSKLQSFNEYTRSIN